MHLKSLTLKGFKSFRDSTTLGFEPGVTVVVGPNGSGKSNVVDAIAWALGAQAPSAVRSQRMDDVVFAGTAKSPALGRAEVTLAIDNSSGLLPIEFSEVEISRTLFRDGESSYTLNGAPCRLLDVVELLSDTGVGRRQHVIVSQSQMDTVLNANSSDRRSVIEEAAGVLKHRKRKDRAQRRLESVEGDLVRARDLVREVRRQLRPLEKQASAARRHGDLVAELAALRVYLAGREIAGLRHRLRSLAAEAEARDRDQRAVRSELEDLGRQIAAGEQLLAGAGDDDTGRALAGLEALKERARGLAAVVAERRRSVDRERTSTLDRDVISDLESEAGRCRSELAEIAGASAALGPDRFELAELEAALAAMRSDFDRRWGRGPSGAEVTADGAGSGSLAGDLQGARSARDAAAAAAAAAEAALREAEAEHHRAEARLETLSSVVLDPGAAPVPVSRADSDPSDGVLGTLGDLIDVDEGAAAAVAAALGPEAGSVVAADPGAARRLLGEQPAGSVLIAPPAGEPPPDGDPPPVLPAGLSALRDRVRARTPAVEGLLDVLLGAVVMVDGDWQAAARVAADYPRLTVVTAGGDRLSSWHWRLGAGAASPLRAVIDEAGARARLARAARDQASAALAEARSSLAVREARAAELAEALDQEQRRLRAEARSAIDEQAALAADGRARIGALATELDQRRRLLEARLGQIASRLEHYEARRRASSDAAESLDRRSSILARLGREIEHRARLIDSELAEAVQRRRRQSEEARAVVARLEGLRQSSAAAERRLDDLRSTGARADVEEAELRTRLQGEVERLRADHRLAPDAAVEAPAPELDPGLTPAQRMEQLERELEVMGPVNPLALEEHRALQERWEHLRDQLDDIRRARRDLAKVIAAIDDEIGSVFGNAFADVAANFEALFETLFPGGRGRLRLEDPDDLLNSGIEISARPSGKNVRKLSLLSGGERTLTALAFLFAVFRSRPSPFYVMDEVEAALDDVNLHRFLTLLDEFRTEAQLVIISHQKRTMEAADRLYGVSMKPGGSSVVVSERMAESPGAEAEAA